MALCGKEKAERQLIQDTICLHVGMNQEPVGDVVLAGHSADEKCDSFLLQSISSLPLSPRDEHEAMVYTLLIIGATPQLIAKVVDRGEDFRTPIDKMYFGAHHKT